MRSVLALCEKLGKELDTRNERIESLEQKVAAMELYARASYTQVEVADLTGWSTACINKWVNIGFLDVVPGSGKNVRIPASEVKKIMESKGYGPKMKGRPEAARYGHKAGS